MAELADAADLKSAGLKKLVGVRVPLSAPSSNLPELQKSLGQMPYICGGAMRNRTSVPLSSLKFFFLAVITVVAGALSRIQFSFTPSIPIAPLESSRRFDFGSFWPFRIAVCTAAPELACEVTATFPVRCVGSVERFIE